MKHLIFGSLMILVCLSFLACQDQLPGDPQTAGNGDLATLLKYGAGREGETIKVMTRNVYVGADLDAVLAAAPEEIPLAAAVAFGEMLNSDFTVRAEGLVTEIEIHQPHLIGLQEISLVRIQSPGDLVVGGTEPATEVFRDYLQILMDALHNRGLNYSVAAVVENFDVEVPKINDDFISFDDIRLTDFDVILARNDVKISNVKSANYDIAVPFMGLEIYRGYVAVNAKVGKNHYRFVNTHLESGTDDILVQIRLAQAAELADFLENEAHPVILVGDLNSAAPDDLNPAGPAYAYFLSQEYVDVWPLKQNSSSVNNPFGYTSVQESNLRNEESVLYERIDFVMVRNRHGNHTATVLEPVWSQVVGDDIADKVEFMPGDYIWLSDHAGVVAEFGLFETKHTEH